MTRVLHRCLILAAISILAPAPGAAQSPPPPAASISYRGMALGAALQALQRQGLALIFTNELVRPEMRVGDEPVSGDPRAVLDAILAPHGLTARANPSGVLVVVAAAPPAWTIEGTVLAHGNRQGLAGALVRADGSATGASTDRNGHFSLHGVGSGTSILEVSAPGHLDERIRVTPADQGEATHIVCFLHPQLYLEDEIVVRPSLLSLLLERSDSSFSFSREEIDSLPHLGGDVFRALSLLPGAAANDVSAEFSVRGGRRDEVQVLLDGQELYGGYHLKDYDNALSLVPAAALAGVSLATGSYPVRYGDRMSAVLDLRSLEPEARRRSVLGLSILDGQGLSSGRFAGSRGGWLLSGRRGSIDLAHDLIGGEDPRFWDAFGKAELDGAGGLVGARLLVTDDRLEIDAREADGFERLANDYNGAYAWLTHQRSGRAVAVDSAASWTRSDTNRLGAGADEEVGYGLRDRRQVEVGGLSQSWSLEPGGRFSTRLGGELRRYDARLDYFKALDQDVVILAPFAAPRRTTHQFSGSLRGRHTAVWASERLSLGRLTAELGLRHDRHSATDDAIWSPRVNLGWRLGERGVLRAAWGRFAQSQRPYELQVEDGEHGLQPAELSVHSLLGYEALLPPNRLGVGSVRVELYRRAIDDPRPRFENLLEPINYFPETEPDRVRIAPARSTAAGLELLVRGSRGTRCDWWLAYSFAHSRDRLGSRDVPRALDQPHTASLDVHFRLPRHWDLNLAWRIHSGWPSTPVTAVEIPDPDDPEETELVGVFGPLRSERLPTYHRLDLRASRRWQYAASALTFFVDIQNVYNRHNLAGFDVTLDEDAGRIELAPEAWPGVFPSLGVSWEF